MHVIGCIGRRTIGLKPTSSRSRRMHVVYFGALRVFSLGGTANPAVVIRRLIYARSRACQHAASLQACNFQDLAEINVGFRLGCP
jgi:hypothetical protein